MRSFFMGGFECSAQRRADGTRLDLLQATRHAELVGPDYAKIARLGINVARDGVRWHLVEQTPAKYAWDSVLPMLRAARREGIHVIWDLCHYGWPDHIDIWSDEFVACFAEFAAAFAALNRDEVGPGGFFCPINEISFFAWAGGEVGRMAPFGVGRGIALKFRLAQAALAATASIQAVDSRARFICAEPLIHVAPTPDPASVAAARSYRSAQFEAADILIGQTAPHLGGHADALHYVGVNFYPDNQWYLDGSSIPLGHHAYRSLSAMLIEVYERYRRPLLITETGAEGHARPYWLHYVAEETCVALEAGVPIEGICLYPILDYPGWENDRPCDVGLLGTPDALGLREVYAPLLAQIRRSEAAVRRALGSFETSGQKHASL